MRPARVAGEDIAEGAIIDHVGPSLVFLDNLAGAVEVATLSLYLLEAAWLSMNDWFCAWLAGLEFGVVSDAIAEFACPLADVRGGLSDHAAHLACRLDCVEAGDALPVLLASCRTDFEVGGEIVAALVLWKVTLTSGVPCCEAAVANALGQEDLLAVVVVWLVGKDVFKGCDVLGDFDALGIGWCGAEGVYAVGGARGAWGGELAREVIADQAARSRRISTRSQRAQSHEWRRGHTERLGRDAFGGRTVAWRRARWRCAETRRRAWRSGGGAP
eukprot:4393171-Prymnesium_polylepis.1